MLNYLLPFIILILIVVFIPEYGHYYFAKKYGVGVTDFSIGFGKKFTGMINRVQDGRFVDTFRWLCEVFGDKCFSSRSRKNS